MRVQPDDFSKNGAPMKHELKDCALCNEPVEPDELDAAGWCEDCVKIVATARAKNYPDFIKNRDPGDET